MQGTLRRGGETVINICRMATVDASDFVWLRQINVDRGLAPCQHQSEDAPESASAQPKTDRAPAADPTADAEEPARTADSNSWTLRMPQVNDVLNR
jgi:hypothetical protein